MSTSSIKRDKGFSYRLYCLLLYGYPAQFRRMYAMAEAVCCVCGASFSMI